MLRFLKGIFNKPGEKNEIRYAPGTKIPYRENLINELISEHHTLLQVFKEILRAQKGANHKRVFALLNEFKSHLRAHLLKENTLLYVYLKHVTENDISSSEIVSELQQEMGHIGKDVFGFVQKWTRNSNTIYGDQFLKELKSVGAALVKRIENEESNLYPFYIEPGSYN